MRVVQIAAEFAPIAKAGGLGEVLLGLSRELTRQHISTEVLLPKYSFIDSSALCDLKLETPDFTCFEKGKAISNSMWSACVENCRLLLLEERHPSGYFQRKQIYGEPDDIPKFLYFCKSALEYLKLKGEPIDILHLHDWHAAICAPLARLIFKDLPIRHILLTIHNLGYQGKCGTQDLDAIGLNGYSLLTPDRLQDPNPAYPQTINLLKGGIAYADRVTTVSPSYAKEILTEQLGCGLHSLLQQKKTLGILNGIDSTIWNSATDPHLTARYRPDDSSAAILNAKKANKEFLQKSLNLDCRGKPLVSVISRLVPAKGPDLMIEAIEQVLELGGAFALLGSAPSFDLEQKFEELKQTHRGNPRVFLQYTYDDVLAHQLLGASDFILVPSLSEPCGLTQILGLRYGAIPIIHATGGLKDTVFDCEDGLIDRNLRNGFVFKAPTSDELKTALKRAFSFILQDKAGYQGMIKKSLQADYSWKSPAAEYLKLYRQLNAPFTKTGKEKAQILSSWARRRSQAAKNPI